MSSWGITVSRQVVFSDAFTTLTGNAQALYYRLLFDVDEDGLIEVEEWEKAWKDGYSLASLIELCSAGLVFVCADDKLLVCDFDSHKLAYERAVEEWDENDAPW